MVASMTLVAELWRKRSKKGERDIRRQTAESTELKEVCFSE